jgi:hypothetical protein
VRIEYGHPIRSAITVHGIVGYAANNSRIRGSNASATDPNGRRTYRGGPALASAKRTVFREIPKTRAISEFDNSSARLSRRISAQSSTLSTRFLPGSTTARVSGKLLKIRLPHPVQYSGAVDTPWFRAEIAQPPVTLPKSSILLLLCLAALGAGVELVGGERKGQ